MFYRREKPRKLAFSDRIGNLKDFGFETREEAPGRVRVSRDRIAAIVTDVPGSRPHVARAGLVVGDEILLLVNGGFQMFWGDAAGKRIPALAPQLHALHRFEEDLKQGLGLISLYNEGLGTTSDLHLYDRVRGRDAGVHRPWERKPLPAS